MEPPNAEQPEPILDELEWDEYCQKAQYGVMVEARVKRALLSRARGIGI